MKENLINKEEEDNNQIVSKPTFGVTFAEDIYDIPELQQKTCCLCCCKGKDKSGGSFRKGWKSYLKKEGNDSSNMPFQMLTRLYINKENAIDGLKNIRLNPNLVSENKLRNDLEFYIPQLCTFLLYGELKGIQDFFVFLCKACDTSFFFAHRVHWFLAAMVNHAQEKKNDVINTLKMVNALFKSESKKMKKKIEKFYITNSEKYIDYIKDHTLYFLYNNDIDEKENIFDKIDFNSLDMYQQQTFNKYKRSRDNIIFYSQNEYIIEKNKEINKLKKSSKIKNINEILTIYEEDENKEQNFIKSNLLRVNEKFKPDDFFIDISNFKLNNPDLTQDNDDLDDIEDEKEEENLNEGNNIINLGNSEKDINYLSYHSTLNFIEHLCDISNDLVKQPKAVQKLFLYKKLSEINKKLPCNVYLPFLQDSARNYLICHIPIDNVKIFRTKTKCPIMLTFEMVRIDEIINSEKSNDDIYEVKDKKLDNIIKFENEEYTDTDYNLSKPMIIGENTIQRKLGRNKTQVSKESDFKNNQKFLNIIKKFNSGNKLISSNEKDTDSINTKNRPKLDIIDIDTSVEIPKKEQKNKNEEKLDKNSDVASNLSDTDSDTSGDDTSSVNSSKDFSDFNSIFGETFQELEQNLKNKSPFGNFKTYKIFRCIIKTHDDLRQEQFATQLINEFNQIFKLENVNCWLNTYEIISTGTDTGLVEMVNNSLSLDMLKQKLNNISLREFYLFYWGKGHTDTPEYKKAMTHFVESLAGYSLICYFLQIKDRHNANILIDKEGYLTHIDFGFLLSNAPGKGLKFEQAPFKLSRDMVENLGGDKGHYFEQFRKLLKKGFLAVHKHREKIIILVEMMWCGNGRNLKCFEGGQETIDNLRKRLEPKGCDKKGDVFRFVDSLIEQSIDNWRTKWYDIFQYYAQGIFY